VAIGSLICRLFLTHDREGPSVVTASMVEIEYWSASLTNLTAWPSKGWWGRAAKSRGLASSNTPAAGALRVQRRESPGRRPAHELSLVALSWSVYAFLKRLGSRPTESFDGPHPAPRPAIRPASHTRLHVAPVPRSIRAGRRGREALYGRAALLSRQVWCRPFQPGGRHRLNHGRKNGVHGRAAALRSICQSERVHIMSEVPPRRCLPAAAHRQRQ